MPVITKKNVFHALNEFYGEILEPRFDGIDERLDEHDQRLKDLLEHLPFPPFEVERKNGFL